MSLVVFNTLTRTTEPFETIEPGRVRMYVCGPTVYSEAHVGHAMSSIVFDFVRRYLEYKGYEVRHVMNFTDVDDKIIAARPRTARTRQPWRIVTRPSTRSNCERLNVLPPTALPASVPDDP